MRIEDFDVILFDLDGTVYYGSKIIDGANDTINFFRKNGKTVFFTTNNSTKTRRQIYERLINLGVDCNLDEVLTSGYIAALFAKKRHMEDVYIFGSENLIHEFCEMGVNVNQTETAKNLLIGYDPEMNYEGLTKAIQVALHANCIMACNKEKLYPGENKKLMPGCGAMTAPIEWCTGRSCDYVIGKPNTLMLDVLHEHEQVDINRFLVIGDTYQSDIVMAKCFVAKSILIASEEHPYAVTVDSIKNIPNMFVKQ